MPRLLSMLPEGLESVSVRPVSEGSSLASASTGTCLARRGLTRSRRRRRGAARPLLIRKSGGPQCLELHRSYVPRQGGGSREYSVPLCCCSFPPPRQPQQPSLATPSPRRSLSPAKPTTVDRASLGRSSERTFSPFSASIP